MPLKLRKSTRFERSRRSEKNQKKKKTSHFGQELLEAVSIVTLLATFGPLWSTWYLLVVTAFLVFIIGIVYKTGERNGQVFLKFKKSVNKLNKKRVTIQGSRPRLMTRTSSLSNVVFQDNIPNLINDKYHCISGKTGRNSASKPVRRRQKKTKYSALVNCFIRKLTRSLSTSSNRNASYADVKVKRKMMKKSRTL
eukprot:TCONS_00020804-protein